MMISIQSSKAQYQPHLMIVSGLIKDVRLSLERMEKLIFQLTHIRNLHPNSDIRIAADKHLTQQLKVSAIAKNLTENVKDFGFNLNNCDDLTEADQMLTQYQLERELLDDLDFVVRKRFLRFIQHHYEARIIPFFTSAA